MKLSAFLTLVESANPDAEVCVLHAERDGAAGHKLEIRAVVCRWVRGEMTIALRTHGPLTVEAPAHVEQQLDRTA